MSKEINLIYSKKKSKISQERLIKLVNRVAYIIVAITALSAGGIYFLNQSVPLAALQKQESTITQNLTLSQQKILKLMLIKDRLSQINTITNQRKNFDETIATIISSLPEGVSVNTFALNTKAIDITVSSHSLVAINQFLDFSINKLNSKELFSKLTVNGLVADTKSQTYSLLLEATPL